MHCAENHVQKKAGNAGFFIGEFSEEPSTHNLHP
jgi:hypothetical protein